MTDEHEGKASSAASGRSGRRPRDTLLTVLRRFWRLWGLLAFLLLLLIWFRGVVLPFVFAMLIAYLLEPLVRRMAPRLGERRGLSVLLLYLGMFALGFGFLGGVLPGVISDLSTLRESTPSAMVKVNEDWLPRASEWFEETFPRAARRPGSQTRPRPASWSCTPSPTAATAWICAALTSRSTRAAAAG